MKYLIFRLIIPLTIISFALFTKWWYALPIDAPDTMFTGFPWPYTCPGWHTSGSKQIFILEFIADFFIYFIFWIILIFLTNRYIKIKLFKFIPISLWVVSIVFISFGLLFYTDKNNIFYFKRPFEIEVLDSGFKFTLQNMERPDYNDYQIEVGAK